MYIICAGTTSSKGEKDGFIVYWCMNTTIDLFFFYVLNRRYKKEWVEVRMGVERERGREVEVYGGVDR